MNILSTLTPILALWNQPYAWLIVLAVILLLFGGRKLPSLARGLGKSIKEFKKATDSNNDDDDDDEDDDENDGDEDKKQKKSSKEKSDDPKPDGKKEAEKKE